MTNMRSFWSQRVKAIQTNQVWSFIISNVTFCFGLFWCFCLWCTKIALLGTERTLQRDFFSLSAIEEPADATGRGDIITETPLLLSLRQPLYALPPASSSSLFERTWDCRGRCHQGKPSASRCPWWCRGWRSAWSEQRTYRGPKSSSPDGCQMSYSGCWCSGRTDARPSSSDAGTESWWSPVGGEKRGVDDLHQYMQPKCLHTICYY